MYRAQPFLLHDFLVAGRNGYLSAVTHLFRTLHLCFHYMLVVHVRAGAQAFFEIFRPIFDGHFVLSVLFLLFAVCFLGTHFSLMCIVLCD